MLGGCGGHLFSPNMAQLDDIVNSSNYTAISSSNIDTACFFNLSSPAYLWDYELHRLEK